ncbi:MAG: hypothetical protein PHZ19_12195 [Candidatus Thermoplasmatota archaeon]|nr:hypothetical protein [Candidatus Thermoplasmatota archaeon]
MFGGGRAPLVTGGEEEEERRRTPQKWRGVKRPEGTLYFAHNGQLVRASSADVVEAQLMATRAPLEVKASAESGSAEDNSYEERGVSGLDVQRGKVYDDYNAELKHLRDRMARYEEMRRSDTAVATLESLISLPLRKASWRIEAGEGDTSEAGLATAARIERNIKEEMTHSWDDFLRLALLAPLYGFTIFEQVWEKKWDGMIGWRKLADRDRGTVDRWFFDETGGVQGYLCKGYTLDDERKRVEKVIEIEDLLLFTWREEAGNPEGLGLLRQAYKPVTVKAMLEEMACIRLERQALGIPVARKVPGPLDFQEEIDEAEAAEVLNILQRLRVNEDVGVVLPMGWEFEYLWPGPADVPFESLIERQHQYILQTMLAQFIGFSQGGDRGSFGLSKDASSLYLYALGLLGDWLANVFNRYAIPRWMENNGLADQRPYPVLVHGPVGLRDIGAWGNLFRALFDRNVNTPRLHLSHALEESGLPPMDDESWEQLQKVREMQLRRGAPAGGAVPQKAAGERTQEP